MKKTTFIKRTLSLCCLASIWTTSVFAQPSNSKTFGDYDATVIKSNYDGSPSSYLEYIYFRSGNESNTAWYNKPQLVIQDDEIRAYQDIFISPKDRDGSNDRGRSILKMQNSFGGVLNLTSVYENNTHRIGFSNGANSWISYADYPSNNWIVSSKVGIGGVAEPKTNLDVKGAGMFRNGNTAYAASKSQIFFGYDGTSDYAHAIKSRHNAGYVGGNAIDFYLWKQGSDGVSAMTPTQHVMTLDGDGTMGIGTTAPATKLHLVTNGSRTAAGSSITLDNGTPLYPTLRSTLRISNSSSATSNSYEGQFGIKTWITSSTAYPFLDITTLQDNVPILMGVGDKTTMQIFKNQVLIGSNLPFPSSDAVIPYSGMNYTLGVRGRIVSSGITCKDLSQWADYVFDDSYELKPLDEVSDYIAENKHLPDVPSAKEVIEKGLDVSDMLKIQMQKIEELTLYTIRQQKQLQEQQQQINKLVKALATAPAATR